ncbi:MAG TPA: TRAP transporter substrate-binding protein DctP, partial [Actinomycetales bacterium]|nr:TRAP transporter substrate-binding protein DctP [Actinomycetales bacterium]
MTALTAALALATTGCQGSDRAGGNAGKEVILTFANPNDTPPEQLLRFADEVAKRSAGTLKIDFKNRWRAGERESERGTVRDIRDGKVAMGWVGARVLDQVGVTTFQPLLAPLLVDSQDLQQKVFGAGIPGDMLAGVEKIDLVGVGVLPGPMRKLLSKRGPLTTPAALAGLSVGIQDSRVAEQTFATLGATTVHEQSGAKIADVDGYEQQLSSIWGNHYEEQGARSVVGNLNLWPRPLVILAGKQRWEGLSADQHKALRAAGKESVQPALDASRTEDTGSVAPICHAGIAMPQATAAQLAALEQKLAPVYDAISAADSKNKGWLERIRQLRTQVDAGPDTARCTGILPDQGTEGALPDGTYEMTLTPHDISTGCPAGRPGSEYLKPLLNYPKTLQQTV